MRYSFKYITESTFVPAVEWHFFKLRVLPCNNEFQQIESHTFEVLPSCHCQTAKDGLGNEMQWGSIADSHDRFVVRSEGVVRQTLPYCLHEAPVHYYLTATHLTDCPACAAKTAALSSAHASDVWQMAGAIMRFVHGYITYTSGHTTTSTTAQEVWDDPRGVCQDYAHLMIAMCRTVGIYARYVCGFIEGEGQTHAWVEVSDGKSWLPFDPTLNLCPEWGYVKIAHGRDADDCPTNRGRFYSWTTETMSVQVRLTPLG